MAAHKKSSKPGSGKPRSQGDRKKAPARGKGGSQGPPSKRGQNRPARPAAKASDGRTRLNKFLAHAGVASRREADTLISTGLVQVNDKVVTEMGQKVGPGDVVKFNGAVVNPEPPVYYVLNKPKGYITTVDDPKARKTVMELMSQAGSERIYPVGRLDRKTTGVLLFTNDGDLAKALTHPAHGARKIYQVTLSQNLEKKDFHAIKEGLELEDGPIQVDEVDYVEGKSRKHVGLVLHSGRNRIVRRIFEHLGYEVTQLDRTFFAGITKKNLSRGQWRRLETGEVQMLKKLAGSPSSSS